MQTLPSEHNESSCAACVTQEPVAGSHEDSWQGFEDGWHSTMLAESKTQLPWRHRSAPSHRLSLSKDSQSSSPTQAHTFGPDWQLPLWQKSPDVQSFPSSQRASESS